MFANRMHFQNTVHFVTNRTEHEMLFLLPTARINSIIQCWFARALNRYGEGLEIYAFIFLSNHFHLLINDTKGSLAVFMCYFQANVAKAINEELGRKGRFWVHEYDDVIVEGDAALLDRYAYTVGNAVKAGLVNTSAEWIGWSSFAGAVSDGKYCFEMLDRTKLHSATRRKQKVEVSKFIDKWEFALTPPPFLDGKTRAETKWFIENLMESAEAEFRSRRGNKPPLGVKNILKQRPTDRPQDPSFRPRIKVFCLDPDKRDQWLDGYRTFVGGYREIFDAYRKASYKRRRADAEWPQGSYPPSCRYPIGAEAAS